jgi:hypothetical protein
VKSLAQLIADYEAAEAALDVARGAKPTGPVPTTLKERYLAVRDELRERLWELPDPVVRHGRDVIMCDTEDGIVSFRDTRTVTEIDAGR